MKCLCGCGQELDFTTGRKKKKYIYCHYKSTLKNKPEDVWKYIDRRGEDECWPWMGSKSNPYGKFKLSEKTVSAHRLIWEMFNGMMKKDMLVCHTCNNTYCCNPNHLYLGTSQDNMNDRKKAGHYNPLCGEESHLHKLTEIEVKNIRKLYSTKLYTYTKLGEEFNVHRKTISRIVNGKNWRKNYG